MNSEAREGNTPLVYRKRSPMSIEQGRGYHASLILVKGAKQDWRRER